MQRNTGYFPTESLEPSGNRLFSRSALNEGYLFRGSLRYSDDSMISINCTAVEDEVANSRFQQSELDYLIYNDPVAYADLILNGDPKAYLKNVTEYKPLD